MDNNNLHSSSTFPSEPIIKLEKYPIIAITSRLFTSRVVNPIKASSITKKGDLSVIDVLYFN